MLRYYSQPDHPQCMPDRDSWASTGVIWQWSEYEQGSGLNNYFIFKWLREKSIFSAHIVSSDKS